MMLAGLEDFSYAERRDWLGLFCLEQRRLIEGYTVYKNCR